VITDAKAAPTPRIPSTRTTSARALSHIAKFERSLAVIPYRDFQKRGALK